MKHFERREVIGKIKMIASITIFLSTLNNEVER